MWKEVLLNRWVLGAFLLLVICIVGCVFWTAHVNRQIQEEIAKTRPFLDPVKSDTASTEEGVVSTITPGSAHTEEIQRSTQSAIDAEAPETVDVDKIKSVGMPTDETSIDSSHIENVRVSLFSFGPYPMVPLELYPDGDEIWDNVERIAEYNRDLAKDVELMTRVRIKLWELGTETVGATGGVSGIHPIIPNVAYVKWGWQEGESGEPERYIKRIRSPAGMSPETRKIIEQGETPLGWTVMDLDEGIIDPYTFLELE